MLGGRRRCACNSRLNLVRLFVSPPHPTRARTPPWGCLCAPAPACACPGAPGCSPAPALPVVTTCARCARLRSPDRVHLCASARSRLSPGVHLCALCLPVRSRFAMCCGCAAGAPFLFCLFCLAPCAPCVLAVLTCFALASLCLPSGCSGLRQPVSSLP